MSILTSSRTDQRANHYQLKKGKDKKTNLISRMYQRMGKMRSISRDKETTEVKKQIIDDRVGDEPM